MGLIAYAFFMCYIINHGPNLNGIDVMLITTAVCILFFLLLFFFPPKK